VASAFLSSAVIGAAAAFGAAFAFPWPLPFPFCGGLFVGWGCSLQFCFDHRIEGLLAHTFERRFCCEGSLAAVTL
jgi:hypothetical protein